MDQHYYSSCPHCKSGTNQSSIGLIWDESEGAWRCLLCGYRGYVRPQVTKEMAIEEALWDKVLDELNEEDQVTQPAIVFGEAE